jgi:hypothetical protein
MYTSELEPIIRASTTCSSYLELLIRGHVERVNVKEKIARSTTSYAEKLSKLSIEFGEFGRNSYCTIDLSLTLTPFHDMRVDSPDSAQKTSHITPDSYARTE